MPKALDDLLAMSSAEVERYAATLQPGTFVGPDPWILGDLDELRLRLEEAMWGDLSDAGLVRHIAHLRRCIQYKEAVARGEERDESGPALSTSRWSESSASRPAPPRSPPYRRAPRRP